MVIWGTRGVKSTKASGDFFCPSCNSEQHYNHKRVRRFFTLYFIPLIPLNELGDYVECTRCKQTYNEKVLNYNPRKEAERLQMAFHAALKSTMIEIMLADGEVDETEVQIIMSTINEFSTQEAAEVELRAEIETAEAQTSIIMRRLRELGPQLNDDGRERIIQAGLRVATADGSFDADEKKLLGEIASALGMTDAHLAGVIAMTLAN